jgi:hypothetical protein
MNNKFFNQDGSPINPINPDKFLDITQATAQEVVEFALDHLIEQGKVSFNEGLEQCEYKGEVCMCAAAPFIPNYKSKFDGIGTGWRTLTEEGEVPIEHASLIYDLQYFHDGTLINASDYRYPSRILQTTLDNIAGDHNVNLSKYNAEMFNAYFEEKSDDQ